MVRRILVKNKSWRTRIWKCAALACRAARNMKIGSEMKWGIFTPRAKAYKNGMDPSGRATKLSNDRQVDQMSNVANAT